MENNKIVISYNYKFLGIILDNKFKYTKHLDGFSNKW